jgi:hypothetical protein
VSRSGDVAFETGHRVIPVIGRDYPVIREWQTSNRPVGCSADRAATSRENACIIRIGASIAGVTRCSPGYPIPLASDRPSTTAYVPVWGAADDQVEMRFNDVVIFGLVPKWSMTVDDVHR